ncbi:fibroblast growth factor receptor-like 1 [Homarus americanus]|uniref:fibroblast growth factor receptor-like 1 n=1 Tax=Homarus americanus TaxID=6706 RepID=UPI001C497C78|nr:fibroblast growth factor receptor-like 1 [Homarus americanus]
MVAGGRMVARQAALMVVAFLTPTTISLATGIKDAPRRTTQKESELKVVRVGEDVKLICPIEGTPTPIYEWMKGDEVIPEEGWDGMRLQGRTLRMKEITSQDHGFYTCTAVNGFGKETFSITLTVTEPLADPGLSSIPGGLPPEFSQLLPPAPGKIDKPVGHNVKLKCSVTGKPEPTVTWYKDGLELREGSLGGESRLNRHSLHLLDLRPEDAGTYTCAAVNDLGARNANWTLRVIDQARPKEPEFNPLYPANTTVVAGESATFQCSGNSDVTPHIKWLRRLEDGSNEAEHIPDKDTLNWKGHRYIVLQATQVHTPSDGSFYTKLVIPHVSVQDTGVYVCTATSNFGLAYRQALLSVIDESPDGNTLMLVVGLACLAGVILVITVVVMVRRVQTTKPPPPPGPNESALLPPPPINQGKMQPPASHHPRYVPGIHNQQTAPHGHAVGPEGPLLQYAGGVVHLPPQSAMAGGGQGAQPIIVYQDPATAASVYIAQRPPAPATSTGRPEYQYQHLDVI